MARDFAATPGQLFRAHADPALLELDRMLADGAA